jgi:hypothetical protein
MLPGPRCPWHPWLQPNQSGDVDQERDCRTHLTVSIVYTVTTVGPVRAEGSRPSTSLDTGRSGLALHHAVACRVHAGEGDDGGAREGGREGVGDWVGRFQTELQATSGCEYTASPAAAARLHAPNVPTASPPPRVAHALTSEPLTLTTWHACYSPQPLSSS